MMTVRTNGDRGDGGDKISIFFSSSTDEKGLLENFQFCSRMNAFAFGG